MVIEHILSYVQWNLDNPHSSNPETSRIRKYFQGTKNYFQSTTLSMIIRMTHKFFLEQKCPD